MPNATLGSTNANTDLSSASFNRHAVIPYVPDALDYQQVALPERFASLPNGHCRVTFEGGVSAEAEIMGATTGKNSPRRITFTHAQPLEGLDVIGVQAA